MATARKQAPAPVASKKAIARPAAAVAKKPVPPAKPAVKVAGSVPQAPAPVKAAAKATTKDKKTSVKTTPVAATKKAAPALKPSAPVKKASSKAVPAPVAAAKAAPALVAKTAPAPVAKAAPAPVAKAPAKKAVVIKPAPAKPTGPVVIDKFLESQLKLLAEERAIYTHQAKVLKAEADALVFDKDPGDTQFDEESGEGDTISFERERDLVMSAQALNAVADIDAAEVRIYNGSYGICQKCNTTIIKERLKAIPWAALCVRCKAGGLGR